MRLWSLSPTRDSPTTKYDSLSQESANPTASVWFAPRGPWVQVYVLSVHRFSFESILTVTLLFPFSSEWPLKAWFFRLQYPRFSLGVFRQLFHSYWCCSWFLRVPLWPSCTLVPGRPFPPSVHRRACHAFLRPPQDGCSLGFAWRWISHHPRVLPSPKRFTRSCV